MESLITTKPLTTSIINAKLRKLDCFVGTYPRDMLPKTLHQSTAALVINTDTSDKPGQHWVAIYISNGHGEYFDSFGLLPLTADIYDFLNNKIDLCVKKNLLFLFILYFYIYYYIIYWFINFIVIYHQ